MTTFNSSDSSVNITLSNGNLTATWNGSAGGVRSTTAKTSGKLYFEATPSNVNATTYVGLANSTYALTAPANNANEILANIFGAFIVGNGSGSLGITGGAISAGQACGIAIDVPNLLFWYTAGPGSWNGSPSKDPATNVGGISFSYLTGPFFVYAGVNAGTSGQAVTVNFGATAFSYAVPSGFVAWDAGALSSAIPTDMGLVMLSASYASALPGIIVDASVPQPVIPPPVTSTLFAIHPFV